jgi:hypothetical protein
MEQGGYRSPALAVTVGIGLAGWRSEITVGSKQPTPVQLRVGPSNSNPTEIYLARSQSNCEGVLVELNWLITHTGLDEFISTGSVILIFTAPLTHTSLI